MSDAAAEFEATVLPLSNWGRMRNLLQARSNHTSCDSQTVHQGPVVARAPSIRKAKLDRNGTDLKTLSRCSHHNRAFGFEPITNKLDRQQEIPRVDAKAGLHIRELRSGCKRDQLGGEAIACLPDPAHIAKQVIASSEDQICSLTPGLLKFLNLLGKVLAVGVKGHHAGEVTTSYSGEGRAKSCPFALIAVMG
jgi:hypothetical protein